MGENSKLRGIFSRETDDWRTPTEIYNAAMGAGFFDPCPFKSSIDGLALDWAEKNFVNPPYSNLRRWVIKSIEEASKGKQIILLIPARTDTRAFKAMFDYGTEFIFIMGRLHFNDSEKCAPFPSMIAILRGGVSKISLVAREEAADYIKKIKV